MPVEIKELVIRAEFGSPSESGEAAVSQAQDAEVET